MSNEHITDERLAEVLTEAYGSPEWTMADVRAARAVEAASLALRPAAQPVSDQVPGIESPFNACTHKAYCLSLKSQHAGEPFGWWFTEDPTLFCMPGSGFRRFPNKPKHTIECVALYTAPQQEPERAPMTLEQRAEVFRKAEARMVYDINLSWRDAVIEEAEAHHGITAPNSQPTRTE